jgi:hypothetical protein
MFSDDFSLFTDDPRTLFHTKMGKDKIHVNVVGQYFPFLTPYERKKSLLMF